jgi:two-component SAPR family response regulator
MEEAKPLRGRRILLVEDESLVSMMIEDMLVDLGCIVVGPVDSAALAAALVEHETVDCAVLDVGLSDGQVFPLAEALVARGVPFVFATGYHPGALDSRYSEVPLVEKPFEAGALEHAIMAVLNRPR